MDLSLAIRHYRKSKKISQEELADLMGVSQDAISSWESGRRGFPVRRLTEIAKALGVTESQLVNWRPAVDVVSELYVHPAAKPAAAIDLIPVYSSITCGKPTPNDFDGKKIDDLALAYGYRGDFALRASGSSMCGYGIEEGDYVVFVRSDDPGEDVGAFYVVGEAGVMCKKFKRLADGGAALLSSDAPPMIYREGAEIRCIGRVSYVAKMGK